MLGLRSFLGLLLASPLLIHAATHVQSAPVPQELRSSAFTITVNGQPVDVVHAAASYEYASFDATGPVNVEITAADPGFWNLGVDIEPWRLSIRPKRDGQTIRFKLDGPAKLSITRPGEFLNHSPMLFLFAGTPPQPAPQGPNVHVYGPGVYRQSLNPKSGDTLYLAPGSYFFGSLNLWQVDNVKVLGRGTIIYDGPQDPATDEGWMQKPDWHCIDSLEAHNVEVRGVTCVLRSRTWSIQMKDSTGFRYIDLRVIGGNPGNANQDGMDWIGSSDGLVSDSFFRASDDVIAMMGNWDGYKDADMLRPGRDVHNILVENSELSTSISNVVRAGWPRKIFSSRNFTLRNSDVLHAGIGACVQPFGLLGFWGANGSRGDHSHYEFENLFLDHWYSLVQMEQEQPALHDFTFRNIWALDQPPLVDSSMQGQISGVTFDNVKYGQKVVNSNSDVPLTVTDGAKPVHFNVTDGPVAQFTMDQPAVEVGKKVTFTARSSPHTKFIWLFGDGSTAHGHRVHHTFTDADGTELDGRNGAGRFRVLLHAVDDQNRQDWAGKGVVVVSKWMDADSIAAPLEPGLAFRIYPGTWAELPDLRSEAAASTGESPGLDANPEGFTNYAVAWDGFINIPADGGYTFHLLDRDGARLVIDGAVVAATGPAFTQVCGSPGNAMRYDRGSLGLRAGKHHLHVEALHIASEGDPKLLWEGPSVPLNEVPATVFTHPRQDDSSSATHD